MKKILIGISVFSLFVAFVMAQQGAEGKVYKGLTGDTVPGCTVVMNSCSVSWAETTITNTRGYYQILTPYPGNSNYIKAWIKPDEEDKTWESDWENLYIPVNQIVEHDITIFPPEE